MRQAILIVLGAAGSALGRMDGTATWLWEVTTQDGDALVEPGETATVSLSVDMDPNVNYPDGPVLGFAGTVFDTLGGMNADLGAIVDFGIADIFFQNLGDDFTTTDGVSMFGTTAFQDPLFFNFSPADPILVFEFEWQPGTYDVFDAQYVTATRGLGVFEGDLGDFQGISWGVNEADIVISVVPAPAGSLLITTACVGLALRRRRPHS
jgi:hypothetical protein